MSWAWNSELPASVDALQPLCVRLVRHIPMFRLEGHIIRLYNFLPGVNLPGWRYGEHTHDHYEAHLVLQGGVRYEIGGAAAQLLCAGSVIVTEPEIPHSWEVTDAGVMWLVLVFDVEPRVAVPSTRVWPVWPDALADAAALLNDIHHAEVGWRDRHGVADVGTALPHAHVGQLERRARRVVRARTNAHRATGPVFAGAPAPCDNHRGRGGPFRHERAQPVSPRAGMDGRNSYDPPAAPPHVARHAHAQRHRFTASRHRPRRRPPGQSVFLRRLPPLPWHHPGAIPARSSITGFGGGVKLLIFYHKDTKARRHKDFLFLRKLATDREYYSATVNLWEGESPREPQISPKAIPFPDKFTVVE